MTDCTSASALTGGSTGGVSSAPAGLAIRTSPATPAAVPAAATVSAVLFLSIALSLFGLSFPHREHCALAAEMELRAATLLRVG
ncbi:hypothetical protein GCM10010483_14320 [Actinokineospora diospyrosa]